MNAASIKKVISTNTSTWSPENERSIGKRGLYEVWFLLVNDAAKNHAYWIRYTLLVPKASGRKVLAMNKGEALLWFGIFDAKRPGASFILKKSYPLNAAQPSGVLDGGRYRVMKIGVAELTLDMARGEISTSQPARSVSWNLNIANLLAPYHHVPPIAKLLRITTTIPITQPDLMASGEIVVDGDVRKIESAHATLTHIIGKEYADPWVWAHCNSFLGAPGAFFEMIGRDDKASLGFFDGKREYFFNKVSTMLKVKKEWTLTGMTFSVDTPQIEIKGVITVPKEALVGVEYKGPKGEKIYCYNSEVGSGKITLILKSKGHDTREEHNYTCSGAFAFETTHLKPVEGIKFLPWESEI